MMEQARPCNPKMPTGLSQCSSEPCVLNPVIPEQGLIGMNLNELGYQIQEHGQLIDSIASYIVAVGPQPCDGNEKCREQQPYQTINQKIGSMCETLEKQRKNLQELEKILDQNFGQGLKILG